VIQVQPIVYNGFQHYENEAFPLKARVVIEGHFLKKSCFLLHYGFMFLMDLCEAL